MKKESSLAGKTVRYRIALQDVPEAEFREKFAEHLAREEKRKVTIMLDGSVIDFFREKAGARGYQTLINEALKKAMRVETMEATLRRVLREELKSA